MPKEQPPLNLEALQAKERKLQGSLLKADRVELTYTARIYAPHLEEAVRKSPEKARSWVNKGQLLQPQHIALEANIRVADIRGAIRDNAIPKIVQSLGKTQEQIRTQDESPEQISMYASHLEELKRAATYVEVTKDRVIAGLLTSGDLDEVKAYYSSIESLQQTDPELARAKEVYLAKLQKQERQGRTTFIPPIEKRTGNEQEPLASLKIDRSVSTVQVGGNEVVTLTKAQMAIFARLARETNEAVKPKTLRGVLKNAGVSPKTSITQVINEIRAKIEVDPNAPKILTMTGSRNGAKYAINANVEFIGKSERSRLSKEGWKIFEIEMPDGQVVKIQGQRYADTLKHLLPATIDNPTGTESLSMQLYGKADRSSRSRVASKVAKVKSVLKPYNWTVIQPVPHEDLKFKKGVKSTEQQIPNAKYYLEKITPDGVQAKPATFPPTPPVETPPVQIPPVEFGLRQSHLDTLDYIRQNPDGRMQTAIALLRTTKKGIPHTRPQAAFAANRALWHLFNRNQMGIATEAEQALKTNIEQALGLKDVEAKAKFKEIVTNFFSSDRKQVEEVLKSKEVKEPIKELPTEAEVALLVTIYKLRRDIIKKYELPQLPQDIIEEALKAFPGRLDLAADEIVSLRNSAYDKFASIVQSDQLNELYDQAPESTKKLIIYFMEIDPETQLQALKEALLAPTEAGWKVVSGRVQEYWKGLDGHEIKSAQTGINPIPDPDGKPENQKHTDLADLSTSSVSPDNQTNSITEKPKVYSLERHDPQLRQRIQGILDQLESIAADRSRTLTVPQLGNLGIKAKFAQKVEREGYIQSKKGRDHHPIFTVHEVAILLYLKDFANGLSKRDKKQIRHFVQEELAKRDEQN